MSGRSTSSTMGKPSWVSAKDVYLSASRQGRDELTPLYAMVVREDCTYSATVGMSIF